VFNSFITSFAQTGDGYLWLGSESGLMRFDGVRFMRWDPPAGQSLPSPYVRSLLAGRDGTLWIGTLTGLASWKNTTLTPHRQLDGQMINALVEEPDGTIWIASSTDSSTGQLCALHDADLQCAESGRRLGAVFSLHVDHGGVLWVGASTGLWQWK